MGEPALPAQASGETQTVLDDNCLRPVKLGRGCSLQQAEVLWFWWPLVATFSTLLKSCWEDSPVDSVPRY